MTADPYDFWRSALALVGDCGRLTREQIAELGGVHEDEPRCGFWRKPVTEMHDGKRVRLAPLPAAIWIEDGHYVGLLNGQEVDPYELATWVVRDPITEETYHAVMDGALWPEREDVS